MSTFKLPLKCTDSWIFAAALITAMFLSPVHTLYASDTAVSRSSSCDVRVTATVKAYASSKVIYQDPTIIVTQGDIERGYVDVTNVSRLEVRNNNRTGYLLVIEGLSGQFSPFKEVHIQGLGRDVQIDSTGGLIRQPYISGTVTLQLSYRFMLSNNATAGTYAWPLMISAQPL